MCQRFAVPFARFSLFVIFFWFGILKVVAESPANPLVEQLLERTLPFITFEQFIVFFGMYEVVIGIIFLFPKLDRISVVAFGIHMITTIGPLVLVPAATWQAFLVPTLEGQYIIKNVALVALAISIIASHRQRLFR